MRGAGADACLVTTSINTLYIHQQVFKGYTYFTADNDNPVCFVKRPVDLSPDALQLPSSRIHFIHKPEQIPALLKEMGFDMPSSLMVEGEEIPRSEWVRLEKCFEPALLINGSAAIRMARSVKTPWELEQIRTSSRMHEAVYRQIPEVFHPDMSELDFLCEIEHLMRKGGSLGLLRIYGDSIESYSGQVLYGDNAVVSSPYDFALGGAGHRSNPIGSDCRPISMHPGKSVLIDLCGNFTGYLDDLTRCFTLGKLPEEAYRAHRVALDIQQWIGENLKEGAVCEDIYAGAIKIATTNRLENNFMGLRQHAGFVGHGVGLSINELPVLAPRMKTVLEKGMVLAVEPKMVLEGIGAVGIENTFIVGESHGERLAALTDELIDLLD